MADRFYNLKTDEFIFNKYNPPQKSTYYHPHVRQLPLIGGNEYDFTRNSTGLTAHHCDATSNGGQHNLSHNGERYNYGSGQQCSINGSFPIPATYPQVLNVPNVITGPSSADSCIWFAGHDNQLANGVAAAAAAATAVASSGCYHGQLSSSALCYNRNRYTPYMHNRACAAAAAAVATHANNPNPALLGSACNLPPASYSYRQFASIYQNCPELIHPSNGALSTNNGMSTIYERPSGIKMLMGNVNFQPAIDSELSESVASLASKSCIPANNFKRPNADRSSQSAMATPVGSNSTQNSTASAESSQSVTLQITNLDYSMDEASLRNFLLSHLKPITPVQSLIFEGSSFAKVTVPDLFFAKQVVSNLHRKKIGHKRMVVSYTRDSSLTEFNTLRCQVAGLLKDVPYYTLPMYKFRELFQSRFKTSISVIDLYKMQDICTINADNNEEKFISLQPELINSLESSPLMEGLQHSVPYCTIHFKREQHKGWAEQEIEPLPNVRMTIAEIQQIIYPLLKAHPGDIPVASLVHCIEGELNIQVQPNENGVNLEHLICCVQGIQIQMNNFGIKILGWLELDKENMSNSSGNIVERGQYGKNNNSDPLYQISREVIELVKMSPKATMKFNRFIPAYHNHFGKQCRVADYGYTKLIELFEALSSVVQIMGDGENRQITLTHRTQIRRFTSDLLRVLRAHGNKSVLLSQLPTVFGQTQNRLFDVTDYGVCNIVDILDGLVNSNVVVVSTVQNGDDILISIPKRKQTNVEIEKTSTFAGEMVELFRNAPQYTIFFQKFVRSYHYHFAYQCRLSDYGFLKLADLMEAIKGVVELEMTNDEDKKIYLSPLVAQRVFAEQCEELITNVTGSSKTCMKLSEVLELHKKKFGYQIQPQLLGVEKISDAVWLLPSVEVLKKDDAVWIICHNKDTYFRGLSYRVCVEIFRQSIVSAKQFNESKKKDAIDMQKQLEISEFITGFNQNYTDKLSENTLKAMRHLVKISDEQSIGQQTVQLTAFTKFLFRIVELLEQRQNLLIQDLKTSLNCNNTTTFEFGFPNLYSVLIAYTDVFLVNLGSTSEQSEVSLQPNTELRFSYANNPLNGSVNELSNSRGSCDVSSDELINHSHTTQGLAEKTEIMSTNTFPNMFTAPSVQITRTYSAQNTISSQFATRANQCSSFNKAYITKCTPQADDSGAGLSNSVKSNTSSSTLSSNKENSLNNSSNFFNSSLNSSNGSMPDLNSSCSLSSFVHQSAPGMTKLWERRQPGICRSNQILHDNDLMSLMIHSNILPTISSKADGDRTSRKMPLQSLDDNACLYDTMSHMKMYPLYQPPKPDTPPSDNVPFWIDPIWSNSQPVGEPHRRDVLNIKLPDMKPMEVLPMLLSPYTLSKFENMKQQTFNFDSHDRKIA